MRILKFSKLPNHIIWLNSFRSYPIITPGEVKRNRGYMNSLKKQPCRGCLFIIYAGQYSSPAFTCCLIVYFLSLWPPGLVFATRLPGFFLPVMLSLLIFLFSWMEIQEVVYANTEIQNNAQPFGVYFILLHFTVPG
jgi:hypothetical protein